MKNKVYSILPKAGLANRLLVWARGCAFAHAIHADFYVHGWYSVAIGPWIRGERSKRLYFMDIKGRSNWSGLFVEKLLRKNRRITEEPSFDLLSSSRAIHDQVFVFRSLGDGHDLFADLHLSREMLRSQFYKMLRSKCRNKVDRLPNIDAAVHIRRGDFISAGWQLSTEDYFVDVIDAIRSQLGAESRCVVFTDANRTELSQIARIPNVSFHDPISDVVDLVQMSKAKIIATSLGSTYGYFAAFLSDAQIINHPGHWQGQIGDGSQFEGTIVDFKRDAAL